MNDIYNPAARTADKLKDRSPQGQLEMLHTALAEGYAIIPSDGFNGAWFTIEWHNVNASGVNELVAIANWITLVEREAEDVA